MRPTGVSSTELPLCLFLQHCVLAALELLWRSPLVPLHQRAHLCTLHLAHCCRHCWCWRRAKGATEAWVALCDTFSLPPATASTAADLQRAAGAGGAAADWEPHPSNNRAFCEHVMQQAAYSDPWFSCEQQYTLLEPRTNLPLGRRGGRGCCRGLWARRLCMRKLAPPDEAHRGASKRGQLKARKAFFSIAPACPPLQSRARAARSS